MHTAHEHHAQSGHSRSRKAPRARPATATSPVRRARPTPSRCALTQGNATLKHTTHCGTPCTMSVFEPLGAEGDAPRNSRGSHASLLAQDPERGTRPRSRRTECKPGKSALAHKRTLGTAKRATPQLTRPQRGVIGVVKEAENDTAQVPLRA